MNVATRILVSAPSPNEELTESTAWICLPPVNPTLHRVTLSWSDPCAKAFRAVLEMARRANPYVNLPTASLRAAISMAIPEAIHVDDDLGGVQWKEKHGPFASLPIDAQDDREVILRVSGIAALWAERTLGPWCARRGLPPSLTENVRATIACGGVTSRIETLDATAPALIGNNFGTRRDEILSTLAKSLEGHELLPGLGAFHRIVRSAARDNTITFTSWPRAEQDCLSSAKATFRVESFPGYRDPFLALDLGRIRWMPSLPDPADLKRANAHSLRLVAMSRGGPLALDFGQDLNSGAPTDDREPSFVMKALSDGFDPGASVSSLVAAGASGEHFLGVRWRTLYAGYRKLKVGFGATEFDRIACLDATSRLLGERFPALPMGDKAKSFRGDGEKRHALDLAQFVALKCVRDLGLEKITDMHIEAAMADFGGGEHDLTPASVSKVVEKSTKSRAANAARIRAVHGDKPLRFVLFVRSRDEGERLAQFVDYITGGMADIQIRILPPNVHDSKDRLPGKDLRNKAERFRCRINSWTLTAEDLRGLGGCHVIVQFPQFWTADGVNFRDDPVNKPAARIALARLGDANVQYLTPPEPGRPLKEYAHRVSSAVLDLVFGHSAVGRLPAPLVTKLFPENPPDTLIGFSVVKSNAVKGKSASSMLVAIKIDVKTGLARMRVGVRSHGRPVWAVEEAPFHRALRGSARLESPTLGHDRNSQSETYQTLVDDLVREVCATNARPIAVFDATSATGLWSALSDRLIGGPADLLGQPFDPSARWPGARIARVRSGIAPKLVTRKKGAFEATEQGRRTGDFQVEDKDTSPSGLYQVLGTSVPTFISTFAIGDTQQLPRGLSVFASRKYAKAAKTPSVWDQSLGSAYVDGTRSLVGESYRTPSPIDIAIPYLDFEEASNVANLLHLLRKDAAHAAAPLSLPTPLFFADRVKEYLPDFVLDLGGDQAEE